MPYIPPGFIIRLEAELDRLAYVIRKRQSGQYNFSRCYKCMKEAREALSLLSTEAQKSEKYKNMINNVNGALKTVLRELKKTGNLGSRLENLLKKSSLLPGLKNGRRTGMIFFSVRLEGCPNARL